MDHVWIIDEIDEYWTYFVCKTCKLEKALASERNSDFAIKQYKSVVLFTEEEKFNEYSITELSCAEVIMNQVME